MTKILYKVRRDAAKRLRDSKKPIPDYPVRNILTKNSKGKIVMRSIPPPSHKERMKIRRESYQIRKQQHLGV